MQVGDVGHPTQQENERDGSDTLRVAQIEAMLMFGGVAALHGAIKLADVTQLLPSNQEDSACHDQDGEDGRQEYPVDFQVDEGFGKYLFVGTIILTICLPWTVMSTSRWFAFS